MEKFKIDWVIDTVLKNPTTSYYTYDDETATFIAVYINPEYPEGIVINLYVEFNDDLKGTEFADGGHEDVYFDSLGLLNDYPKVKDFFYLQFDITNFDFDRNYFGLVEQAHKKEVK